MASRLMRRTRLSLIFFRIPLSIAAVCKAGDGALAFSKESIINPLAFFSFPQFGTAVENYRRKSRNFPAIAVYPSKRACSSAVRAGDS